MTLRSLRPLRFWFYVVSPLNERLQLFQHKGQDVVFRYGCGRADGPLGPNDSPSAAAAGMPRDDRFVARRVERQLDVVLGRAIRHQPHASPWREHRKDEALCPQHVGNLLENGDRGLFEKHVVRARSLVDARQPLGGLSLVPYDCLDDPPLDVRDFSVFYTLTPDGAMTAEQDNNTNSSASSACSAVKGS